MIKFSLVIPLYNSEKNLTTLFKQLNEIKYKNHEIILINDGSQDNTEQLINSYSMKNPNCKIINQENKGPGIARNQGLLNSTGDYIWFIDSDDYFNTYCFESLNTIIQENTPDIITFNYFEIKKKGYVHFKNNSTSRKYKIIKNESGLLNNIPAAWGKIYNKKFLIDNNIYFPVFYYGEDFNFFLKSFSKANKIIETDYIMYGYLKNQNSISSSKYATDTNKYFKLTEINIKEHQDSKYKELIYFIIYNNLTNYIKKIKTEETDINRIIEILEIENNSYYIVYSKTKKLYENSIWWKITQPFQKILKRK